MALKESVMESVVSFMVGRGQILVKLQAFTMNGSERICDGVPERVCF